MRYYDTSLRCEVFCENDTTIVSDDERVVSFFKALPKGKELKFTDDGLPLIVDRTVDIKAQKLVQDIEEAKLYLSTTDWYYARKLEDGDEVPEEVIVKRKEARDFIRNQEDV